MIKNGFTEELISPCGINCIICKYHHREKNTCPGCRELMNKAPKTRFHCIIRECKILKSRKWKYCSDECENYPCKRLKALDKRYSTKYHMSMLENLVFIKDNGIDVFIEKEEQKWKCPKCGGVVTCHGGVCMSCSFKNF